jgi:hypothetical protein
VTPGGIPSAAAPNSLATRAVYSFSRFPTLPERHFYLHHDGYITGAAFRFAAAQRLAADASSFLAAFLSTQRQAESLASLEQAADAEYHYRVRLLFGSDPFLEVRCWRRRPGGGTWIPRCGPMPMEAFLQRFLPADQW